MSLPAARSSSLRCLSREERSDFEQIRRSGDARTRSGEVERGVRRSLLNTSYSSEEILAAASTGEKRFHRIKLLSFFGLPTTVLCWQTGRHQLHQYCSVFGCMQALKHII